MLKLRGPCLEPSEVSGEASSGLSGLSIQPVMLEDGALEHSLS